MLKTAVVVDGGGDVWVGWKCDSADGGFGMRNALGMMIAGNKYISFQHKWLGCSSNSSSSRRTEVLTLPMMIWMVDCAAAFS